jgi:hypothetical protein
MTKTQRGVEEEVDGQISQLVRLMELPGGAA